MKRFVFIACVLFFTCIYIFPIFGQLSGTKVIGTTPSDYTTFSAAVSALNTSGISGNVVFEIKPDTYTEQISINQITGADATKTVTFQSQNGDSTSVILQFASSSSSANNYVIQLNGADYITFDKLTIKRTDTLKNCQVIEFMSGARKNTFSNCIIDGNANAGNTQLISAVIGSNNTGFKSFNIFENNIIQYGSYGLYFIGQSSSILDSGVLVRNNKFINQSLKGIHIESHRFAYIEANEITNNTTNNTYNAIYVRYSNDTMRIIKNKIAISTGFGINIWNCNETITPKALIANNFVSVINNGNYNSIGIYIFNSKYQYVLYNSVNIQNTQPTNSSCININGSSTQFLYVKNNIFKNSGGGYAYYVSGTTSLTPISESDYNDMFIGSGTHIGYWKTVGVTTLASWRTTSSLDANSFIANPNFVSSADLHATSTGVNGMATTNLSPFVIKNDIDGDIRSTTNPDVGADEFHIENLGINLIVLPPSGVYCVNTAFNVKVYIKNYSLYPFSGTVPVYYKIGYSTQVNETTTGLSVPAGDSILYTFTNNEMIATAGNYNLLAGTNLVLDNNRTNDTTSRLVQVLALPVADFSYLPNGLEVSFTNMSTDATTYLWSFGDGFNSNDQNPVHTYADFGDYIVTLTASNACTSDIATQTISVAGIDESMDKYGISLWPNPASNYVHINIKNNKVKIKSIGLYNVSGVLIYKNDIAINNDKLNIDFTSLAAGMYFVALEIGNKILYQKVLKNK